MRTKYNNISNFNKDIIIKAKKQNPKISSESKIRDPLSEVTRKERRSLLGASIIGLAMNAGLVPTKITSLGIEFDSKNMNLLINLAAYINIFFLLAFIIYAINDFLSWRLAIISDSEKKLLDRIELQSKNTKHKDQITLILNEMDNNKMFIKKYSNSSSILRGIFDFLIPVMISLITIILLFIKK